MSDFIHFEDRDSDHPLIEKVWRCRSDRADRFLSVAATSFEIAITRLRGEQFITLRGPETVATTMDCPGDGEWTCIRFKPGAFMPWFPLGVLRDRNDVTLPNASTRSFWLNGSAVDYPTFENAEAFVQRLARDESLAHDRLVIDTLKRQPRSLSLRSAQRHFLRSTGVTYATFRQIERARQAVLLIKDGVPILDVVHAAGYFDQAHMSRALRRFIGETPSNLAVRKKQLSFLYKTGAFGEVTLPERDS